MGAFAAAVGPSAGAVLVDAFGWRSIFAINVPVALIAVVAGRQWLVESRLPDVPTTVDLFSVPLASLGIGAILLGVVQAETLGPGSPAMIGTMAVGVGLVAMFLYRSRRHPTPLFDLELFSIRSYAIANGVSVLFVMAFFSWLVTLPSFIQDVWGWSVLQTGFAIAPGPLMAMFTSPPMGKLAERIGPPPILAFGGVIGSAGLVLQRITLGTEPAYVTAVLLPGLLVGIAAGSSFAMLVAATMRDVPPARFGMAGAGRTTIFQLGVAAGVAMGFALTAGTIDAADSLSAMQTLFVVGAVFYALQAIVFSRFYPTEAAQ